MPISSTGYGWRSRAEFSWPMSRSSPGCCGACKAASARLGPAARSAESASRGCPSASPRRPAAATPAVGRSSKSRSLDGRALLVLLPPLHHDVDLLEDADLRERVAAHRDDVRECSL